MPARLQWQPVSGAARYRVRLSEVDRQEIWSSDTVDAAIDLPPDVRARIVPGKTLVWQVTAYGASNAPIAESSAERFRLVRGASSVGWRSIDYGRAEEVMLAAVTAIALGATVFAGGDSGSDNDDLKFRIRDEMGPPGGMVQMKVESYEVTPISGGRPSFSFDPAMFADAEGFDMFVTGELAGAAVIDGSRVALSYATNGASTTDYPILTVSMRIRPDAAIGTKTRLHVRPAIDLAHLAHGDPLVASRLSAGDGHRRRIGLDYRRRAGRRRVAGGHGRERPGNRVQQPHAASRGRRRDQVGSLRQPDRDAVHARGDRRSCAACG